MEERVVLPEPAIVDAPRRAITDAVSSASCDVCQGGWGQYWSVVLNRRRAYVCDAHVAQCHGES